MLLMRLKQSVEDIPEYTGNTVLVDFWNSSKSALEHCREEVYTQGAWDYADCQAEHGQISLVSGLLYAAEKTG